MIRLELKPVLRRIMLQMTGARGRWLVVAGDYF